MARPHCSCASRMRHERRNRCPPRGAGRPRHRQCGSQDGRSAQRARCRSHCLKGRCDRGPHGHQGSQRGDRAGVQALRWSWWARAPPILLCAGIILASSKTELDAAAEAGSGPAGARRRSAPPAGPGGCQAGGAGREDPGTWRQAQDRRASSSTRKTKAPPWSCSRGAP
jgi:hypothetical protein